MGFLGLFKSKSFDPAEFEKELTVITQSISQTKKQIVQLSRKKKALRRTISTYCVAIYISYVAYLYKSSIDNLGVFSAGMNRASILVHGQSSQTIAAAFAAPFAIGFMIYSINFLFNAWIRSKNNNLKNLQNKHKKKLEELKQVTNFSKTNQLLKKFDGNSSDLNLPDGGQQTKQASNDSEKNLRQKFQNLSSSVNVSKAPPPTTNIKREHYPETAESLPRGNSMKPLDTYPRMNSTSNKRSFQDRILDLIIGSDHNESVEQRYALICANCYTHNGLAPPGYTNPINVTYICRHCGFINGQFHLSSPAENGRSISPTIGKFGDADKTQESEQTSQLHAPINDPRSEEVHQSHDRNNLIEEEIPTRPQN